MDDITSNYNFTNSAYLVHDFIFKTVQKPFVMKLGSLAGKKCNLIDAIC